MADAIQVRLLGTEGTTALTVRGLTTFHEREWGTSSSSRTFTGRRALGLPSTLSSSLFFTISPSSSLSPSSLLTSLSRSSSSSSSSFLSPLRLWRLRACRRRLHHQHTSNYGHAWVVSTPPPYTWSDPGLCRLPDDVSRSQTSSHPATSALSSSLSPSLSGACQSGVQWGERREWCGGGRRSRQRQRRQPRASSGDGDNGNSSSLGNMERPISIPTPPSSVPPPAPSSDMSSSSRLSSSDESTSAKPDPDRATTMAAMVSDVAAKVGRALWGRGLPPSLMVDAASATWATAWRVMMSQLAPSKPDGSYSRPDYVFRSRIKRGTRFEPEAGRYHLYAALTCPWAHRVLIVRAIKGLEEAIPVSILTPGPGGLWAFQSSVPGPQTPGTLRLNPEPGPITGPNLHVKTPPHANPGSNPNLAVPPGSTKASDLSLSPSGGPGFAAELTTSSAMAAAAAAAAAAGGGPGPDPGPDHALSGGAGGAQRIVPSVDRINGCKRLIDVYRLRKGGFSGRATVPMLWDCREFDVVNNESSEIIEILNDEFNEWARAPDRDLNPVHLRKEMSQWNDLIYENVNNGVYKCGFATSQRAYEAAVDTLFSTLDRLDGHLATNRYLCGDHLTLADVRLFTTLIRFDSVYSIIFKCTRQRITDYENLSEYVRDIYQIPGVASTCNVPLVQLEYFSQLFPLNPGGIVPVMPRRSEEAWLSMPHSRLSLVKDMTVP
ncbi:hypothetical protein CBR_g495 [Chara braunii]|uniref:GST C-terminal domain-containing protein n=1 Tax=Chara braunii TaxID=69332 RepID=A0A388KBF1_CHABU|nr:hypothetical protein CBR_g495 [Chara braunii]|eukprot:GBG67359.1 hypothetical protein CBR_g495 [Chara braunii]